MTDTSVKSTLPVPPAAAAAPQTAPAPQAQQAAKSTSPVPQAAGIGPSPLLIGKSFIKQYYQVLSSNPEHITKFYKPNSMISHSFQPSVPAEPKTLSSDQFFQWAQAQSEDESNDGLCFDFGKGAIDAQETIQGGILLVVTGRMKLAESASIFKTFVHTFFLNNGAPAGKKRQFYVHNDILRFISCAEENQNGAGEGDVTTTASTSISVPAATVPSVPATVPAAESDKKATTISPEATSANVDTVTEKEENVPASEPVVEHQQKEKLASVPQDKPSNGETPSAAEVDTKSKEEPAVAKETSKPEVPSKKKEKKDVKNATAVTSKGSNVGKSSDKSSKATQDKKKDASTAPASGPSSKDEKKSKKNKSRGRSRKSRSSSPTDKDDKKNSKSKPKTPGSWASLVAGGAAPTAKPSAAAVAAADAAQQITSAKESKAQESSASEEADVAPTGDGDDATAADTSSSSANANTSNTKPTFFIHFGPKKTGTSTIQYGFTSSYKLLQSSTSYRYVGRTGGGPNDVFPSDIYDAEITETRKGIKELSATLLLHLREGNSPVFSSERLSTLLYNADDKKERYRFENLELLIDSVRQDGFRVKPVVVYRRLFSWVPSYHAQRVFRHKNPECRMSMIKWFDLHDEIWECNNSGTFIDQHPTQKLVDRLNSHLKLDDIAIVNLHRMTPDDEGDIFRQVVREVLPGSKLFLKKFGQEYSLEPSNTSSSKITDFHHLATAVALTDGFRRANAYRAAQKMSKKYDKIVKMFGGEDNIPTLCFSDDQLTKLLEMSLKFEKELLPEWFAMDGTEIDHRNAFQEHVDGGKFCEWDVEKMLQKKELQDFVKKSFN